MPTAADHLPRLSHDCDVRSLPIGPTEAFLLSQVDGQSDIEDLACATGLPEETVRAHLLRLVELGAVELGSCNQAARAQQRPSLGAPQPSRQQSSQPRSAPQPSPVPASASSQPQSDNPQRREAATANQATDATQAAGPSASPRSSDAEPPPSAQTSSSNLRSPLRQPNKGGANLADDELLADGPDLTLEFKRQVLALSRALKDTNHYELLGVERGATKKEIKDAYFAKVQLFHGDRFFNKALGSYKAKIDQIFSALTRANDALTRKKTRAAYDSYIDSLALTTGVSHRPSDISTLRPRHQPSSSRTPASAPTSPDADAPHFPPAPRIPSGFFKEDERLDVDPTPSAASHAGVTPEARTASADARRQLAARRLRDSLGGDQAANARRQRQQSNLDAGARRSSSEQLRARLRANRLAPEEGPRAGLADRYLAIATEAEAAQEWASAANALTSAAELVPNDPVLRERLEHATQQVNIRFSARFKEQAAYEERDGQFERAARSYERAAQGKNSAELFQLAASCMLRTDDPGRRAVELGRQAVLLDPQNVSARLLLARALFSAQMFASALSEVNRALELEPKNDEAKRLHKDFKKSL